MTGSPRVHLVEGAGRVLGRQLTPDERLAFEKYIDILSTWNRVHRIVGSSDHAWLVENVVLDSLLFLSAIPGNVASLLDIGSGAGVPGIPIKVVRPNISVVLVESRRKRASFLSAAIRKLELRDITVDHGRAESLVGQARRFDAVVARCAGNAADIADLGKALVAPAGVVVVSSQMDAAAPESERLVVRNPVSGASRHFIVRRHCLEAGNP